MSIEYHTGFCENCKSDRKLERKTPNHILHFLITVVLGIFTYGLGSIIWIGIWLLISTKFNGWNCHVCGNKCDEPIFNHTDKEKQKSVTFDFREILENLKSMQIQSLIEKLKESSKLIVLFLILCGVIVFVFSLNITADNENNKDKEDKKNKNNVVNATVNVNETKNVQKHILKYNKVENNFCYIYDVKTDLNSASGLVTCKEGQLTINFYDIESKSIVETKTVTFEENKFYIELDNLNKLDLKFEVKLTKKQIEERRKQIKKEKGKTISSVKSYDSKYDDKVKDKKINECDIKKWRYSKYSDEYLVVDGKTTCMKGKIVLEIYDENNNKLGKELENIESGVFSIFFKTNSNPTDINLKYTITGE